MKKGFTVIELIVSFTLVSVISIVLFQLIFTLKELYVSGDIQTTLLNKQGIMTKKIYDDLNDDNLTQISSCGVSCLIFNYQGEERKLIVDVAANTMTYDNYSMKLIEGSSFGQLSFDYSENDGDNIFSLNIPIKSNLLDGDFGIHIVKTYKKDEIAVNNKLNINDAIITANNIDLPVRKDTSIADSNTYWAKIFHQDQSNISLDSDDAYFKNYNEFIKSNNVHKFSSLKSLEVFRIDKATKAQFKDSNNVLQEIDLIEVASKDKTENEKKKINEEYQNGYFEFLLEYPNLSTSNYNLWTQTNNFVTSATLENIYSIDIVYQGKSCRWNGLKYLKDTNSESFANGCQGGDYFAIGTRKDNTKIKGPDSDVDSVNLWVKADEYISKYSLSVIVG